MYFSVYFYFFILTSIKYPQNTLLPTFVPFTVSLENVNNLVWLFLKPIHFV